LEIVRMKLLLNKVRYFFLVSVRKNTREILQLMP
jgi:hypothetical protein